MNIDTQHSGRDRYAENFIILGDILVIVYALLLSGLAFILIIADTSGGKIVRLMMSLTIVFALALIVQAIRQIIWRKHVRDYGRHLGAIGLCLFAPICAIIAAFFASPEIGYLLFLPPVGVAIAGFTWLTTLLSNNKVAAWKKPVSAEIAMKRKQARRSILIPFAIIIGLSLAPWVAFLIGFEYVLIDQITFENGISTSSIQLLQGLVLLVSVPRIIKAVSTLINLRKS
jgi:hypothetical protein